MLANQSFYSPKVRQAGFWSPDNEFLDVRQKEKSNGEKQAISLPIFPRDFFTQIWDDVHMCIYQVPSWVAVNTIVYTVLVVVWDSRNDWAILKYIWQRTFQETFSVHQIHFCLASPRIQMIRCFYSELVHRLVKRVNKRFNASVQRLQIKWL